MHISENVHRSKRFLKTMPYKGTINVLSNLHLTLGTEKKKAKKNLEGIKCTFDVVPVIFFIIRKHHLMSLLQIQIDCFIGNRAHVLIIPDVTNTTNNCFQNLSNLHFMIFELDRKSHAFNILA